MDMSDKHRLLIYVLTFCVLFFIIPDLNAQNNYTIKGHVQDKETGEYLINAAIYEIFSGRSVITNNYGFFNITLPGADTIDLVVSYVGYQQKNASIYINLDTTLNFALELNPVELDEVVINAQKQIQEQTQMSLVRISNKQVKAIPALGGETDILKAYQLMPGITQGGEGSSDFYVRGGEHDQNLIMLDDVPLYYVNHLGGFVSTFNSDIIKDAKIIKGGFPARYGNRLSSVMDIRMKDGNLKSFHGSGTLGMIASKVSLEGPVKNESTSYIISARRFMWDLLFMRPLSSILSDGDFITGYTFYDVNSKINHRFSSKDCLFASFYWGNDNIANKNKGSDNIISKNNQGWGNLLSALRWNHVYNKNLFSNLTLAYTRFRYKSTLESTYKNNDVSEDNLYTLYSGINDLIAKIDLEHYLSNTYSLISGCEFIIHRFEPGLSTFLKKENQQTLIDSTYNKQKLLSSEFNIYVENHIDLSEKISFNLGFRFNVYSINGKQYFSLEPRFSGRFMVNSRLSVKTAYTRMNQNVHLLNYPNFGLPNTDIWIPTMGKLVPEKSNQTALGIAYTFPTSLFEVSLESYYKTMDHVVTLNQGASFSQGINWQDHVLTDGTGESYGIECLLEKNTGVLSGWLSYTYSKTTRNYKELNHGNPFPFRYDRPHSFNINLSYSFSEHFNISALWIYQTGIPITLRNGRIISPDFNYPDVATYGNLNGPYDIDIFSEINSLRMRDYHRLDIGMQHTKQKKRGKRTWKVSIYNVYNRQNPYYYYWGTKEVDGNTVEQLYQKSLFPIMPSISYSFEF